MNSKCLKYVTTAAFLLGFHSKNQVPPAKNYSATATITVKPEPLAHSCVGQAGVYFTEGKTSVFCTIFSNFTFAMSDS